MAELGFDGGEREVESTALDNSACTCDPRFFPSALDAACPEHGLKAFLAERLGEDEPS